MIAFEKLKELFYEKDKIVRMLCPNCGENESSNCGYGHWDYWGEFDCNPPEEIDEDCSYCYYAWCESCKKELEIFSVLSEDVFLIQESEWKNG